MELLRLGVDDAPDVGRLLARAMMDDPLAAYMLPDRSNRKDLLPIHLGTMARYCAMFGEVYGLGAPLEACAIRLNRPRTCSMKQPFCAAACWSGQSGPPALSLFHNPVGQNANAFDL